MPTKWRTSFFHLRHTHHDIFFEMVNYNVKLTALQILDREVFALLWVFF